MGGGKSKYAPPPHTPPPKSSPTPPTRTESRNYERQTLITALEYQEQLSLLTMYKGSLRQTQKNHTYANCKSIANVMVEAQDAADVLKIGDIETTLIVDHGKVRVMTVACGWEDLTYVLVKQPNSNQMGVPPCMVLYLSTFKTQARAKARVNSYEVVYSRPEAYGSVMNRGAVKRLPENVRVGIKAEGCSGELYRLYHSDGVLLLANPDEAVPFTDFQPGHTLFRALKKFVAVTHSSIDIMGNAMVTKIDSACAQLEPLIMLEICNDFKVFEQSPVDSRQADAYGSAKTGLEIFYENDVKVDDYRGNFVSGYAIITPDTLNLFSMPNDYYNSLPPEKSLFIQKCLVKPICKPNLYRLILSTVYQSVTLQFDTLMDMKELVEKIGEASSGTTNTESAIEDTINVALTNQDRDEFRASIKKEAKQKKEKVGSRPHGRPASPSGGSFIKSSSPVQNSPGAKHRGSKSPKSMTRSRPGSAEQREPKHLG